MGVPGSLPPLVPTPSSTFTTGRILLPRIAAVSEMRLAYEGRGSNVRKSRPRSKLSLLGRAAKHCAMASLAVRTTRGLVTCGCGSGVKRLLSICSSERSAAAAQQQQQQQRPRCWCRWNIEASVSKQVLCKKAASHRHDHRPAFRRQEQVEPIHPRAARWADLDALW